jgi:hypothetical protein
LEELNPLQQVENVNFEEKGFDFEYFTSVMNSKTGKDYFFVYDQGYVELDDDVFMLMKRRTKTHKTSPTTLSRRA